MKGRRARGGQPRLLRDGVRNSVIIALLGVLSLGLGGAAQVGTANIALWSGQPTTNDEVVLFIFGTWPDTCVPRLLEVRTSERRIIIATQSTEANLCSQTPKGWSLLVPLGNLSAGDYVVSVTNFRAIGRIQPPYPGDVIGQRAFVVRRPECMNTETSFANPAPAARVVDEAELVHLVRDSTKLAFELYHALRGEPGAEESNLVFSPHSVLLGLSVIYAGARGETESQMAEILWPTTSQTRLHAVFDRLILRLASRKGVELNSGNCLWVQGGRPFLPSFHCLLAEIYGAPPRRLDFRADPEGARLAINAWAEEQTRSRTGDLLPPDDGGLGRTLVLAGTAGFEAVWWYPFDRNMTREAAFYTLDGREILVPMMSGEGWFGYAADEGYQAVELWFEEREISMVIMIPDPGCFEEVEQSLGADKLAEVLSRISWSYVGLTMPKFSLSSTLALNSSLARAGLSDAFSEATADFSGITGERDLWLDSIRHAALVSVGEAGCEIAAAAPRGMVFPFGYRAEPMAVLVDRPFLFLIRDRETGAILFLGRVLDPTK